MPNQRVKIVLMCFLVVFGPLTAYSVGPVETDASVPCISNSSSGYSSVVSEACSSLARQMYEITTKPAAEDATGGGSEAEYPLIQLIARMGDYDPKTTQLKSLDQLNSLMNHTAPMSDLRLKRTEQMVQALAGYQFPPELTVWELVANGIDSYFL